MNRPRKICLCGSTRFLDLYAQAMREATLRGLMVPSIGLDLRADPEMKDWPEERLAPIKRRLDVLHLRKIEEADCCLFLN